jgi:hypothetical protein
MDAWYPAKLVGMAILPASQLYISWIGSEVTDSSAPAEKLHAKPKS